MRKMHIVSGLVGALIAIGAAAPLALAGQGVRSSPNRSTALCEGRNLIGASAGGGAAAGNDDAKIAIVNVGSTSCRLAGYAGIIGVRSGREHRLTGVQRGTFFGNLQPAILAPRMTGALLLGTEWACVAINRSGPAARAYLAAHSYDGVVLVLPDHSGVVHVPDVQIQNACTLSETRLGWSRGFAL